VLEVYDVTGRRVATLVDRPMEPGAHEVTWDGRAETGRPVVSGVYVYRLVAGSYVQARSMVLLK
jgi:hypothetical protein